MNEFEILNIEIRTSILLTVIGILSRENDAEVFWFDLLLELKNMGLNPNGDEVINVPFTVKNIIDILTIVSRKGTNIYDDLYKEFFTLIESFQNRDDKERNEMIDYLLNELRVSKINTINEHLLNGINTLRLNTQIDETPT